MSSGGNRALSAECPIRMESRITRDLKLLDYRKMGFLEENEVILIVGKKVISSARREGERPLAFHCKILRF